MKKIGVITFHKAISYGAGFQAYALQRYLEKEHYEVEIIDYVPKRFSMFNAIFVQPKRNSLIKSIIKFLPYVVSKTCNYVLTLRFNGRFLHLSEKRFVNNQMLKDYAQKYDIYITGSDQVWNLSYDEFENIKPYLLNFAPEAARKISYAASIGMKELGEYEELFNTAFKYYLRRYDRVAVREESAKIMLKNIGIDSSVVLDPTFLLDKQEWKIIASNVNLENYIFVYGLYRNKSLYKLAKRISKKYNYKIVNMADSFDFLNGAYNKIITTHEKLLGYILKAKCVITDSFHGTVLSLNMNTPVYIFPALRNNSRLESLIDLFNLKERYIDSLEKINYINDISMEYENINEKIEIERGKAYLYLKDALSN